MAEIICGTGHRPDKLYTNRKISYSRHAQNLLVDFLVPIIEERAPYQVVAGGALGFDTALALAALRIGKRLLIAIPFPGQERMWTSSSIDQFHTILALSDECVYVSDGPFSAHKMQARNEWMVDKSDRVLALWNGSAGGTRNCVRYAEHTGKPVVNLWDRWMDYHRAHGSY